MQTISKPRATATTTDCKKLGLEDILDEETKIPLKRVFVDDLCKLLFPLICYRADVRALVAEHKKIVLQHCLCWVTLLTRRRRSRRRAR